MTEISNCMCTKYKLFGKIMIKNSTDTTMFLLALTGLLLLIENSLSVLGIPIPYSVK